MFTGAIIVLCFIIIGMMWPEGLWTNAITFINTFFAGIVAWNYFEPLANKLEEQIPSFTYIVDFLAFWLLFVIFFNITRVATDQISSTKARFRKPVEVAGGAIFAIMTAILVTSIFCATLHMAPLGKTPFGGGFARGPEAGTFMGIQIENFWLKTMNRLSKKAPDAKNPGKEKGAGPLATSNTNQFDPKQSFKEMYAARRAELEEYNNAYGSFRVNKKNQPRR